METKLLLGNCLELLNEVEDSSVDLILCDLPYGTTDRSGLNNTGKNRLLEWDSIIDLKKLWDHYKRIIKPKGAIVLTADQPFTSILIMSNLSWFRYEWIWKKRKTTGFLHSNYRPMKETEDVVVFSPSPASAPAGKAGTGMVYNPQGLVSKVKTKKNNPNRLGNFLHKPEHMGKNNKLLGETEYTQKFTNYPSEIIEFGLDGNYHPTQKPVELMEYLIKTYSNEGDIVLDNCMGSGTTGVAAKNTNRNFIGIELDSVFFEYAKNRIENSNNIE
jgi:site-specific DNA-methyltransferase (adenine-specific)